MIPSQSTTDPLALRAIYDRIALATDSGDWEAFGECFVAGAQADYGDLGAGPIEQIVSAIRESQSRYIGTMNIVGTHHAVVSAETAAANTYVVSHHFRSFENTFIDDEVGTHYADQLVRSANGWKISHRITHVRFFRSRPTLGVWT